MSKVLVIGSFNVDLIGRTPHFPQAKETVMGTTFQMAPGGKGFNQGVAAHKAGADVIMISKIGNDPFKHVMTDTMTELNMNQDHLLTCDSSTGCALILVDENTGENEIVVCPGANHQFTNEDILCLEPLIKEAEYVLLQLEINQDANEQIANLCMKHNTKIILNTAPCNPMSDDFISKAYMVTPNEVEAEQLTGIKVTDFSSALEASNILKAKGIQHVIITMGSQGAFISSGDINKMIPSFKVNAIDTTGAGDAFNGGLLAALSKGKDIWEAATFASALAALSVQKHGATPSMPTLEEIEEFLNTYHK